MSRLGKQPIIIPDKTDVTVSDGLVSIKGPLGELKREFRHQVKIEKKDNEIVLTPINPNNKQNSALWGTYASHISNMLAGVNEKYTKKLVVEGVGYKVDMSGGSIVMSLGFSHPVTLKIPEGLDVSVEKNVISVSGIDKELVGSFSAEIRSKKTPEPYKGKGIRYEDEVIRRKQGKKAV